MGWDGGLFLTTPLSSGQSDEAGTATGPAWPSAGTESGPGLEWPALGRPKSETLSLDLTEPQGMARQAP